MAEPEYTIKQFDKALHDRSAFSCGVAVIDKWLRSSITDLIKHDRIRVWCATDTDGRLVGVYSLCAHKLARNEAPALARKNERHDIPAVYLPVIAVAKDLQGSGVGSALMGHAIRKAVDLSEDIAIAAIILDVLDDKKFESRMNFYRMIGFQQLGDDPKRVFLSIRDAKASAPAIKEEIRV
jgi:GNAT superfamily N-acetyltransferase